MKNNLNFNIGDYVMLAQNRCLYQSAYPKYKQGEHRDTVTYDNKEFRSIFLIIDIINDSRTCKYFNIVCMGDDGVFYERFATSNENSLIKII